LITVFQVTPLANRIHIDGGRVTISLNRGTKHKCAYIRRDRKKYILMLPSKPEWRYGLRESTIPWYKDMKLLRRDQKGDCTPVIDKAFGELEHIFQRER
jgi:hypothetical protein